jgi:DNA-directed RNA polymerase III subunit RPC3
VRRQTEREDLSLKVVLDKQERSDVVEDASLLTNLDMDILSGWQQKQEKLSILEMRVEESVFVLRDFGNTGTDD